MDAENVRLLGASYGVATPTIQTADIRLVRTGNVWCIPGTREDVLADWVRDLHAIPQESRTHPAIGECHEGCLTGAELVLLEFMAAIGADPYVIVGHSLGGGIAVLLAALATLAGHPPARLVTCGAMRCCIGPAVPTILLPVPGAHYHDGGDPVTDLPNAPYGQWRERTQIGAVKDYYWIQDHYISAYMAAMPNT